mgnify:CR=1 FL=1
MINKLVFENLRHRPVRTLLSITAIGIQVTMVLTLVGVSRGILNDVALNQVLVRFGDDDDVTRAVVTGVQDEGTCWLSGTNWQGKAAMRISVSNWATTGEDAERSVAAIRATWKKIRG